MSTRLERSQNFALMLAKSRTDTGVSQKTMAQALGKSVNTIQNWESGVGCPNYLDLEDWFEVLGLNMNKYITEYKYPQDFNTSMLKTSTSNIISLITKYLSTLSEHNLRMVAYNIFGETGSSFSYRNNLFCAYNHLPLKYRLIIAIMTLENYNLVRSLDEVICDDDVLPNIDALGEAIRAAKKSAYAGKNGYHIKKTD